MLHLEAISKLFVPPLVTVFVQFKARGVWFSLAKPVTSNAEKRENGSMNYFETVSNIAADSLDNRLVNGRVWIRIALSVFALGAGVECCQALIPYRIGSIGDVLANSAGILLGAIIAYTLTTGSHRSGRAE